MLQYSSCTLSLRLKFVAIAITIKILKSYKPQNWHASVVSSSSGKSREEISY